MNKYYGIYILNVLLKFIEGTTYDAQADTKGAAQIVKLDTSNMTIILGGAFSDVYNSLIVNNTIGFDTEKNSINAPKYRTAETKDFVERGMMTNEFMGRVTVIKLNDLTLDDLKRILREGNESAIRIQETIFNKLGVKIKKHSTFIIDFFTAEIPLCSFMRIFNKSSECFCITKKFVICDVNLIGLFWNSVSII